MPGRAPHLPGERLLLSAGPRERCTRAPPPPPPRREQRPALMYVQELGQKETQGSGSPGRVLTHQLGFLPGTSSSVGSRAAAAWHLSTVGLPRAPARAAGTTAVSTHCRAAVRLLLLPAPTGRDLAASLGGAGSCPVPSEHSLPCLALVLIRTSPSVCFGAEPPASRSSCHRGSAEQAGAREGTLLPTSAAPGSQGGRCFSPWQPAPPRNTSQTGHRDLCSGDVPEVEIISLLGEQLPRYTLRADTVFGYDHNDWLRVSPSPPEPASPLTPQQIEETLQYFRE
ncbi:uncharacterized protein LOC129195200 [Grus americana]|uniref:uncharacterized protein LOC129195200 n=1 Tax=Grus americana TaxID=9117 RepID=UPI002407E068|nr:uncharacterized protein LOC129195200 [Grus americana]